MHAVSVFRLRITNVSLKTFAHRSEFHCQCPVETVKNLYLYRVNKVIFIYYDVKLCMYYILSKRLCVGTFF